MTNTWVLLSVDAGVTVGPGRPWALDGRVICMLVLPKPLNRIARPTFQILHPFVDVLTGVHFS